MPAKNGGGYTQGWNLELAAARRQVLLAIELHDNPADAGALITMIAAAAANCEPLVHPQGGRCRVRADRVNGEAGGWARTRPVRD